MPLPVLCGDPATQPLRPCLGPGSIQGPDLYLANLEEPPLLHPCISGWWEVRQQFLCPLPDRLGDRGGSAEKSALKGY